jgi:SAM-dependent methyltransferase
VSTPPTADVERHAHWDAVAEEWEAVRPHALWRAYRDRLHTVWLAEWASAERVGRALKTDLFDEAYSVGLVPALAALAGHVVGVDVSAGVVRAAQARHPGLRSVRADVRALPFPDGDFDLVVSNSTLDHFESLDDVALSLRELRRVLRPGGRLLLTLDNGANPAVALRNALPLGPLRRLGLVPYYVGATCGPARLRRLLREAGFRVDREGTLLHAPRVLAVWAAGVAEGRLRPAGRERFFGALAAFERLGRLPTRTLTGYFLTVGATAR